MRIVPELVGELDRRPLAWRQPRVVDATVERGLREIFLDELVSRPGDIAAVRSVVAAVEPGDPQSSQLLGPDLDLTLPPQGSMEGQPALVVLGRPSQLPRLQRVGAALDAREQLRIEIGDAGKAWRRELAVRVGFSFARHMAT
jgi:hypothetical protein